MRSPGERSCQATLPVFLLTAMKLGAFGAGTFSRFSSRPFEVSRKSRSPERAGEELAMLCWRTPSSFIMSSFQIMSASVGPLWVSPWKGPSFSRSRNPSVSRRPARRGCHVIQALAFHHRRGADPLFRPVLLLPVFELVADRLPEKLAVGSRKHRRMPLSPLMAGFLGLALLVPTKILPPATTGLP